MSVPRVGGWPKISRADLAGRTAERSFRTWSWRVS
jgi:hypothetical protein